MLTFKQFLREEDTLQTFTPTDHQKIVMLKVRSAPTPKLAADAIVGDYEMSEAAEILVNIGLLTISPGNAEVTPQGEQTLKDLYLIDETGELTDEANQLLQQYDVEGAASEPEQDLGMDQMPMAGGAPGGMEGGMEGDPNAGMSGIPTAENYSTLKLFGLI